jgi:hypothetical protein
MLTKLSQLAAVAGALTLSVVACSGSPSGETSRASHQAVDAVDDSAFQGCSADADCVAVPQAGCCQNGWNQAVNASQTDAYAAAHSCTEAVACPQYVVNDTRVAECSHATHLCEMVAIDAIQCGGFIGNAHTCPDGYDCTGHPVLADLPGSCTKHVDAPPAQPKVCGGIAGLACPDGQTCNYDDPSCDPSNGGADCSGHCQ